MSIPIVTSVKHYFETLPERFQASASKGVKATYFFDIAGESGGKYAVTVDDGTMSVTEGDVASPSATIKMHCDDYVQMVNGELSGPVAFMKGKMKVVGNVVLAQKMTAMFPPGKA